MPFSKLIFREIVKTNVVKWKERSKAEVFDPKHSMAIIGEVRISGLRASLIPSALLASQLVLQSSLGGGINPEMPLPGRRNV